VTPYVLVVLVENLDNMRLTRVPLVVAQLKGQSLPEIHSSNPHIGKNFYGPGKSCAAAHQMIKKPFNQSKLIEGVG